jgi:proline iminopeptidase
MGSCIAGRPSRRKREQPDPGMLPRFAISLLLTLLAVRASAQDLRHKNPHPPGNYAAVDGSKLWYESEGKGDPVVLISGGPGDAHTVFHPFFSRLAKTNRIIYYDPFGVGRSDRAKSPGEYHFARDVDDLEGLRRALGLGRITVLGHSYGGMVAQAYALKYSESVKRLILIDTFYSGRMWQENNDNANREIRNQYPEVWAKLQALRAGGIRSNAPRHQELYYGVPLGLFYFHDASKATRLPKDPSNTEVYYAICGPDADFEIGGDIADLDFRPELGKLKIPVLVLAGRFDRISMPVLATEFEALIPGASFVIFEKSGHFPYIEEPDETFAVLRDFLHR